MKIEEIKGILTGKPQEADLAKIAADERKGVKKLFSAYLRKLKREEEEIARFAKLLSYERQYWSSGLLHIAGVDEAGRGPLAGPLVVAAVILSQDTFLSGLDDSKKVAEATRKRLYDEILQAAVAVTVKVVSVNEIDRYNIYQATKSAMKDVLKNLKVAPEMALIDAMPLELPALPTISIIHGDALSASIAAASIIAKVMRDGIMEQLSDAYPAYDFAANKGYGSPKHLEAIRKHGATIWHRHTYEPVKSLLKGGQTAYSEETGSLIVLK